MQIDVTNLLPMHDTALHGLPSNVSWCISCAKFRRLILAFDRDGESWPFVSKLHTTDDSKSVPQKYYIQQRPRVSIIKPSPQSHGCSICKAPPQSLLDSNGSVPEFCEWYWSRLFTDQVSIRNSSLINVVCHTPMRQKCDNVKTAGPLTKSEVIGKVKFW